MSERLIYGTNCTMTAIPTFNGYWTIGTIQNGKLLPGRIAGDYTTEAWAWTAIEYEEENMRKIVAGYPTISGE